MRHHLKTNCSLCLSLLVCLAAATGCRHSPPEAKPLDVRPKVRLVGPETGTIACTVGQPGFIYAYEQTAIYPKVSGFIETWKVDIGDRIKKDQVIAEIFVPELLAELRQKKAQVAQSEVQIRVAEQMVDVARHNYAVAGGEVLVARANVNKYQAFVERWESEVKRLASVVDVVDRQVLAESQKQLKADVAAREAAKAAVIAAEANEQARKADLEKAKVDVEAARAKAQVDRADEQRLAALVGYTRLLAPYDGVVVARNANTGDYVQPGTGDLSALRGVTDESTSRGAPIYVVARTDLVRVYVDVPELNADYVGPGTKAKIVVQARKGEEIDATVTRTSWSLHTRSRTLRAEIDLPNPQARLLPGMYAYGLVTIERPNVMTVPLDCVVAVGSQNVCFLYENGEAVQVPVQVGISDGKRVEVARKLVNGTWTPFTGAEQVIQGSLAELSNGQAVQVLETSPKK